MKFFKTSVKVAARGGSLHLPLTRELKLHDMPKGTVVQVLVSDDIEADLRDCLGNGIEYPMYHIAVFASYEPEGDVEFTAIFDVRNVTSAKELAEKLKATSREEFTGVIGPFDSIEKALMIKAHLEKNAPEIMRNRPKNPVKEFTRCFNEYMGARQG